MAFDQSQLLAEAEKTTVDLLRLYKDDSWISVKTTTKDGFPIRIFRTKSEEFQGNAYRVECELVCETENIVPYLLPAPKGKRPRWDTTVRKCDIIKEIDNDTFVSHLTAHSNLMGLISPREFYHLNAIRHHEEGTITSVCTKSVESKEFPPVQRGVVRATSYPSGFFLIKLSGDPARTHIVNISQVNAGGKLPQSVVEASTPDHLTKLMRDLCTAICKG